jgi:O-antigen/teichoic acid export membrane protein
MAGSDPSENSHPARMQPEPFLPVADETSQGPELVPESPIGLGRKAQSAVVWNTAFNIFRDALQFAVMLVLVRLLDPRAYGQFSLVTSVIGFISILSFNNFLAYSLQVRREEDTNYQDHFTAGLVIQSALFLITNIIALLARLWPAYRDVAPFIHVMSLTFLISFPSDFRIRMLERQLDWRRLRLLHASGLVIVAAAAIVLAAGGGGTYALLVPGMLVAIPFIVDLVAFVKWSPKWVWSWARYKPAFQFGVSRIGSAAVTNGRQLIESGVLAGAVGFTVLGFFNRALGLAQLFCIKFSTQLLYALYPLLARYEPGSAAFRRVNGLILRTVGWVVIPIAAVLALLAEAVVRITYGNQWLPVNELLALAMAFGAAAALAYATYTLVLAINKPTWCLALDIAALGGTAANLFIVMPLGLRPYLAVAASLQFLLFLGAAVLLFRRRSLDWSGLAAACGLPLLACGAAVIACELIIRVSGADKRTFAGAVFYGALFCVGYTGFLRFCFPETLRELVTYLPGSGAIKRLLWYRDESGPETV